MQADSYRGADCVLGWSFYSQGSKERATAADEFLNWALAKLGVKLESASASAKGEAIAEALMTRRALLVLDGVEPLQHGPGPQAGQLKDQGLRALLRRFAAAPPRADHSLIVLTSRLAVADIQRFKNGAAPVVDVERLSDEAGAELLRDNDVWGVDHDLRAASHDFGGHPLALTLLASLIKETQNGDVRRRDHIRGLLADADDPRHDQARRVMESYEREWLAGQPILLAILHCVGLFDRPASGDCLKALRAKPAIPGLTDALVELSDDQWRRAVARLREARLLAPVDPSDPEALDAHPLVREWFGERLRQTNEAAWKAAHSRLYDHLRHTTREGETPTLADLAPLYHAIAHGCRAGRQQEALDEVYVEPHLSPELDGDNRILFGQKLGAVGSDLAAISWFFDRPYETPAAALTPPARAFVLGVAGFALRAQGRLQEALPAMRDSVANGGSGAGLAKCGDRRVESERNRTAARRDRRRRGDGGKGRGAMRIARATRFEMIAVERPMPTRSMPPANGRRLRACLPTPSGCKRERQPNTPCCIPCRDIGTATCCCRGGGPPRRATGRRKALKLRGGTAGFSTSRSIL